MKKKDRIESQIPSEDFRAHIVGYVLASIFLYVKGKMIGDSPLIVISLFVGVAALFILLGKLPNKWFKNIAKYINDSFSPILYVVMVAGFVIAILELIKITDTALWIWLVLVGLFGFILYDLVNIIKNMKKEAKQVGWKSTTIRHLKILSLTIFLFVFVMLIRNVQGIGAPYIWLAPGIVSLLSALILEGDIKKQSR